MFQCMDGMDIASKIFALDGFTIVTTPMTDAKWYYLWLWRINFLFVLILRCTPDVRRAPECKSRAEQRQPLHPTPEIQISFSWNPKK